MEDMPTRHGGAGVEGRWKTKELPTMPVPRNTLVRCVIRRDRTTSSFTLWQEPPPKAVSEEGKSLDKPEEKLNERVGAQVNCAAAIEEGEFLLAARKVQGLRSKEYIISSDPNLCNDIDIGVLGKLKSNFCNTKFSIYENQPQDMGAIPTVKPTSGRPKRSSKVSPETDTASVKIAAISYKVPLAGPASMKCSLLTIPASDMECPPYTFTCLCSSKSNPAVGEFCCPEYCQSLGSDVLKQDEPFVLNSKTPSWNQELKYWVVKEYQLLSVKNYQPVAAAAEPHLASTGTSFLLLELGKSGKDLFTMDFSYPLSPFVAFAIFLSCLDSKFTNACFP